MNNSRHWIVAVTACLMMFVLGACGGGKANFGNVAVIDLDAVAAATGKSKEIRDAIAEHAKQRENELNKLQGQMTEKLKAEKEKLGKKPTSEQNKGLAEMVNKARQDLSQGIAIAKQEAQQLRIKLINDFRQEVMPHAIKVAAEKNFSVVLIKDQTVFYLAKDADITDAVVVEMNKGNKQ